MAIMSEGPEACEPTSAARGRPGIWAACVLSAASEKAVVPIPRSLKKFRRLGLSIFSAPPCSVQRRMFGETIALAKKAHLDLLCQVTVHTGQGLGALPRRGPGGRPKCLPKII